TKPSAPTSALLPTSGYNVPGYMNPGAGNWYGYGRGSGRGRGRGFGSGGGRGWRNRFYATGVPGWAMQDAPGPGPYYGGVVPPPAPLDKQAELNMLSQQAAEMKTVLDDIQKRMDELQSTEQEK
ncbi:DUF5320 family protein, partial [candidate division CSSED10-310 bacterium]